MSSTTKRSSAPDRDGERGQILVIFVFSLVALLGVAALVFDVGQDLLDRRDAQNAADAAALAGARYISEPGCAGSWTNATCPDAVNAAAALAQRNGFVNGVNNATVTINIPPVASSLLAGRSGHIEVLITTRRASFFANVFGVAQRGAGAAGVAANLDEVSFNYSMLSLDPSACSAAQFGGNAVINVAGAIQVNSTSPCAFKGNGSNVQLHAPDCSVAGGFQLQQFSPVYCPDFHSINTGVQPVPDPLATLPGVPWWTLPLGHVDVVGGTGDAAGCPEGLGSEDSTTGATLVNPKVCDVGDQSTTYRMYPGIYPGGIKIQGNNNGAPTIYMEPGIYYLAGGGFRVSGGAITLRSVDTGDTAEGGGVLLYNSEDPIYHDQCATDPLYNDVTLGRWPGCIAAISITGGTNKDIYLESYKSAPYAGLVIYQDRSVPPVVGETAQPAVKIEGSAGMDIKGTIYVPEAEVKIEGNGDGISAQIIAKTFHIQGNGTLTIPYDANNTIKLSGTFLVE